MITKHSILFESEPSKDILKTVPTHFVGLWDGTENVYYDTHKPQPSYFTYTPISATCSIKLNGEVGWTSLADHNGRYEINDDITDCWRMFVACSKLTTLNLSHFDTSKVTSMYQMFGIEDDLFTMACSKVTNLDLSSWDTSKVADMYMMFANCTGLTTLDVSGWDMSKVTDTNFMFYGCTNLTTIYARGCNATTINKLNSVKPSGCTIVTE